LTLKVLNRAGFAQETCAVRLKDQPRYDAVAQSAMFAGKKPGSNGCRVFFESRGRPANMRFFDFADQSTDHAAFGWNHPNADNVIGFKNLEHAFHEKPVSTFSQHALGASSDAPMLFGMGGGA
jgi:hypothetical protein